jgi:DNA-binding response OmpR family regulator
MAGELVLVVDDERKILDIVSSYLVREGYRVVCAQSGRAAAALFGQGPELVLLDLMLPDGAGEDVCRKFREVSSAPVIMITGKSGEEAVIRGLNLGADDYVTKPFSPRELMARVRAVLRRAESSPSASGGGRRFVSGELVLDGESRRVTRGGDEVSLTQSEFKILSLLMSRPAKIFTRDEIIERCMGDDYGGFDRSVDVHIKNLRQKIGDDPRSPSYIITVYGMGYRFAAQDARGDGALL